MSNLVPKRIVNSKGVQTTVYVKPEQSKNLESNPLRGLGAPQTVSHDAEDVPLTLESDSIYANWHQNHQVMDETGLQDLPEGADQSARETVLKWSEEWRDRNRIHYVGVEDDTTSLPNYLMENGIEATKSARDRGDSQEEQMWAEYTANLVKRATESGELTIKDVKPGLKAAWRRRFPITIQGLVRSSPQDTDIITSEAHHVEGTVVEVDGKQYDLANEVWDARHMAWEKLGQVGEAFF